MFLRFVSVSVSSTKLSHLPLQSSGSSGRTGTQKPWDLGALSQLNSLGSTQGSSCAWLFPFLLGTAPAQEHSWEPKGERGLRAETGNAEMIEGEKSRRLCPQIVTAQLCPLPAWQGLSSGEGKCGK